MKWVERLDQRAEEQRKEQQVVTFPWRCCRCGEAVPVVGIVGIAGDGTQLMFCFDCGEQQYQATLPEPERLKRARATAVLTN